MAIDLFCYLSKPMREVDPILDGLKAAHIDVFEDKFLIYNGRIADALNKEIAADYGFEAESCFLVSLNDKNAAGIIGDVVRLLKDAIGESNILVLFNNEIRY